VTGKRGAPDRWFNAAPGPWYPTGARGWSYLSVSWIRLRVRPEEGLSLSLPQRLRWGRGRELPGDGIPTAPLKIPLYPRPS